MSHESYLLSRIRPLTETRSTALIGLVQGVGAHLARLGSTLAPTRPGLDLHGRALLTTIRAASNLADGFGVPLVPHAIDALGLERHRQRPVFKVQLVRRTSPRSDGWIVQFFCPWCHVEHQHHWITSYDPARTYHRGTEVVCSAAPLAEGYYIALDEASRTLMESPGSL